MASAGYWEAAVWAASADGSRRRRCRRGARRVLDQFRQNGYGEYVDSWVGTGQNRRIAPNELMSALAPDAIDELEQQSGLPRDQLLTELSSELPEAVDQFTPQGHVPSDDEITSQLYGRT